MDGLLVLCVRAAALIGSELRGRMLLYFTATGNSLYVARVLAASEVKEKRTVHPQEPFSIAQELRRTGDLSYEDETIGIVYPVYAHEPPRPVLELLERASFATPYLYLVGTYGNVCAHAATLAAEHAKRLGHAPALSTAVLMCDNWLPAYDMDEQRALLATRDVEGQIQRIAQDVAERVHRIDPATEDDLRIHEQMLAEQRPFSPQELEAFLRVDPHTCVGCSACVNTCPSGCMALVGSRAQRQAHAGRGCITCMACAQVCPTGAVRLPGGEKNPRARYIHPSVTARDLARANSQLQELSE